MTEEKKFMAIMKNVKFDYLERHGVCLSFSAYTDEHSASYQSVPYEEVVAFMAENMIDDIDWFEGKTCWVSGNGWGEIIRFKGFCVVK